MRIQTLFLLKIDLFMFTVNLIARDGDILCGLTQSTIFFISGNKSAYNVMLISIPDINQY